MPLFWLSLGFLIGILLAGNISLPLIGWLLIAILPLLFLFPPVYRRWSSKVSPSMIQVNQQLHISTLVIYPLFFLLIALGAVHYQIKQPVFNSSFIAHYNDWASDFIIEGVLANPPELRDTYTNLQVRVEKLRSAEDSLFIPMKGLLLARISAGSNLHYADRIQLQGHLLTPPENDDFSYRDYLARKFIYSYMPYAEVTLIQQGHGNPLSKSLFAFRDRAMQAIYHLIPDPEASLISGIVLGVQTGIPDQLQEAFRLTGTSHIIVISGFNISIIALLFSHFFERILGRYKGAFATVLGIIFYTLLVGANAAVVRAAVLGLFTVFGRLLGRRQTGVNSLAIVAALMAVQNPNILWDISFQLSFAATLGIMLYAEPLNYWFIKTASRFIPQDKSERLAGPVGAYFLITLAAQITTLPLIIFYFRRLSITSLIANPLILPAQPPLMVLGGLSALIGTFFQPIGQLFAWAAWPFAAYTIRIVEWLSGIRHGSIALGQVAFPLIIIFYITLFTCTYFRHSLSTLAARLTPAIPLTTMIVVTVLVWKAGFYAPDGLLHVTILDVGTGDGILVQSPTGRYVLINGGPSRLSLSDSLGRRLPPFHRNLDWLVVADIDEEDLAGIPTNLERFTPADVLWAGKTSMTRAAADLQNQLISLSIPITTMETGQNLDLGSGVNLNVISTNPKGAILLLEWDNFRLLLPMGMDFEALDTLIRATAMRNISALLLAESGYGPLNSPEFISFLHPQVALLSVAPADRDGLPSPETLESLQDYQLLRTDVNGWIEITTNGEQMWVQVERK